MIRRAYITVLFGFCLLALMMPTNLQASREQQRQERARQNQLAMDERVAAARQVVAARESSPEDLLRRLALLTALRAPGRDAVMETLNGLGHQDIRYLIREFAALEKGNAGTAQLKLRLASFVLERGDFADVHGEACFMKADSFFLISSSLASIREEIETLSRHRSLEAEDRRRLEVTLEALTKPAKPEAFEEAYRLIDLSVNHRSPYGQIQWISESVLRAAGKEGWQSMQPLRHGGDTRPLRAYARAAVESIDFSHLTELERSLDKIELEGDLKSEIHYWIGVRYMYFEKYSLATESLNDGLSVGGNGWWRALCAIRVAEAQLATHEISNASETLRANRDLIVSHDELVTRFDSLSDSISTRQGGSN